jgi:hypothetical protein
MDGVCPNCAAETTATVVETGSGDGDGDDGGGDDGGGDTRDDEDGDEDPDGGGDGDDGGVVGHDDGDPSGHVPGGGSDGGVAVDYRCGNCRYEARVPLFGHVLRHPVVVARLHGAGVDVARLPFWELQALAASFEEAVVSEEPWRARVTIGSGGRPLAVTLDEHLDVVCVEEVVDGDRSDG